MVRRFGRHDSPSLGRPTPCRSSWPMTHMPAWNTTTIPSTSLRVIPRVSPVKKSNSGVSASWSTRTGTICSPLRPRPPRLSTQQTSPARHRRHSTLTSQRRRFHWKARMQPISTRTKRGVTGMGGLSCLQSWSFPLVYMDPPMDGGGGRAIICPDHLRSL